MTLEIILLKNAGDLVKEGVPQKVLDDLREAPVFRSIKEAENYVHVVENENYKDFLEGVSIGPKGALIETKLYDLCSNQDYSHIEGIKNLPRYVEELPFSIKMVQNGKVLIDAEIKRLPVLVATIIRERYMYFGKYELAGYLTLKE